MKKLALILSTTFLIGNLNLAVPAIAAPIENQSPQNQATETAIEIQPAIKEVMKITDHGLEPAVIKLKNQDGSVFFVNTSKQALASIQVNFGKRRVHCASQNLKTDQQGVMRSVRPIGPKDFALTCFPEPGEYKVLIRGIHNFPKGLEGKVIVE